ncbi:thioredoxin [Paenibacillus darwinianus]|uniref:Thioredoxin n=1 Tax=Paenibacillus darwinianus TaxID=1380763 RepID=A0A9W5W8E0_9BACL|nr:thioredoxin family protein [Paenibacillus darwinianus]EXX86928.1 thioredoxin [Paenibacillus darwinianus]EXX90653.1 thioredoxin [Paenibacillus darwinianus]EXX91633.1 thioredoxin [Paenibacillus darwinianus]
MNDELRRKRRREAVFFYTAMCGTCKVAERMLEVAEAAGGVVPISKININFAPHFRSAWQIASVPCLVLLKDGEPDQVIYAMESVGNLYRLLQVQGGT